MRGWWADVSHRLAAKTLVFILLLGALWWNQNRGVQHLAEETHASLCALKGDLERRYESGSDYVRDVEAGRRKPVPGITPADLERSLQNQRATLSALSRLHCS